MKIRLGNVSNSSSSSFIVGVKKGKKLKDVLSSFKVDGPFSTVIDGIVDCFVQDAEKSSKKSFCKEWGYDSFDELVEDEWGFKDVKELFDGGFDVYRGSFSDDCGGIEAMLCSSWFDYESDDLVIKKDGGY